MEGEIIWDLHGPCPGHAEKNMKNNIRTDRHKYMQTIHINVYAVQGCHRQLSFILFRNSFSLTFYLCFDSVCERNIIQNIFFINIGAKRMQKFFSCDSPGSV